MNSIVTLPVWQRLALLIASSLLGMVILVGVVLTQIKNLGNEATGVAKQVPAVRYTQRIIVRALDVRSHLLLGLQHNPANPEIVALHDHAIGTHLELIRKSMAELKEAIMLLERHAPETVAQHATLVEEMRRSMQSFESQGVLSVLRLLEENRFVDANKAIIKETNPAYNKLRKACGDLADAIIKSSAEQTEHMNASVERLPMQVAMGGAVVFIICGLLGLAIARSLTSQIGGEPAQGMQAMQAAALGDLRLTQSNAPAGSMLGSLDAMLSSLSQMFSKIHINVGVLRNSTDEITASMQQIAQSAEKQAGATSSVAAAVEELTVSINHIAESIQETDRDAEQSANEAASGMRQAQAVGEVMAHISKHLGNVSTQIRTLDHRSHDISGIASVIKDIADQTNLLALNAAIEAARAGETGRGFAVVADEVRKLAERTATATGEIEQMISSFQRETQGAVAVMESALPEVQHGAELVAQSSASLARIHENTRAICQRVRESAEATREQSTTSTAIAQEMERIAQNAEEANAAAQLTMRVVAEVDTQATALDQEASRFRV